MDQDKPKWSRGAFVIVVILKEALSKVQKVLTA